MRRALWLAAWVALVTLAAVWWAPSILLAVAGLAADRARFRVLLVWVGVLKALGRRDAARRTLEAALRRCEARRRMLAGQRGW